MHQSTAKRATGRIVEVDGGNDVFVTVKFESSNVGAGITDANSDGRAVPTNGGCCRCHYGR